MNFFFSCFFILATSSGIVKHLCTSAKRILSLLIVSGSLLKRKPAARGIPFTLPILPLLLHHSPFFFLQTSPNGALGIYLRVYSNSSRSMISTPRSDLFARYSLEKSHAYLSAFSSRKMNRACVPRRVSSPIRWLPPDLLRIPSTSQERFPSVVHYRSRFARFATRWNVVRSSYPFEHLAMESSVQFDLSKST